MVRRVQVSECNVFVHRGTHVYSSLPTTNDADVHLRIGHVPAGYTTVAPNATRLVMDIQELSSFPRTDWAYYNKAVVLFLTTEGDTASGVVIRGSHCYPLFGGHVFRTGGIWHIHRPFPIDYRHLTEDFTTLSRPHMEWRQHILSLQERLLDKLLYLSPADVYGEGLTEREQRRGRAAHSILKAQKRRFAHPANVAAEMMKLSHLTEGEEWARILSSRPSELC